MTGARRRRLVVLAIVWLALPAGWLSLRAAVGEGGVQRGVGVTTPTPAVDRFDVRRAMATVRLQLAAGQRPAGSAALRAVAEQLRRRLPQGHFEDLPDHPGLRNIVGELPGTAPAIVLGAHYDTEYHPKGFVGANDAAAAVAAVIEVARVLRHADRGAGAPAIRFVLFDGEEEPAPTDDFYRDALRGSKDYVAAHAAEVRAMVLLDYIGNHRVRLPREAGSDVGVWRAVRTAAARVGVGAVFPPVAGQGIIDDHVPFLRAGIPAVDLIDWDYRDKDTIHDTYDKLSPVAVDAVGETVVQLLRTWR
ncbi:MAG: glutaminyl-peptide cyclotransferase [Baekduia sp.]|nr:glutaminyl-peptide cyclotransferase [Baekduia sp.]